MKKFFAIKKEDKFIFEGDELAHFNVLRTKIGEKIICLSEDGFDYLCEVSSVSKKLAEAVIISKEINNKNPRKNIAVFQGLVKGEKLDLIVQKLTELGASKLITFESEFAIAKANNNKLDRLKKISTEACKQCGRSVPISISESVSFASMIEMLQKYDIILFANEKNRLRSNEELAKFNNIAIVVGSEGGFSDKEIEMLYEHGAVNFGLGERILRAETAAISLVAIVGYLAGV